jgi:4-hydroxybenzoate polyprenyltransferase
LFVFVFILMSRAYSYRKIRLKKYAVLGFLTVFIFQGGFFYLMSASAISALSPMKLLTENTLICMILSSLFLGSAYPLTQIYQHEADKNDGVISLSYKLGYKGTFIFSSIMFAMASILLFYYLTMNNLHVEIFLFVLFIFPVVLTLTAWFNKVRRNTENANFENTMRMNIINSCCMNLYFSVLVLNHLMSWFK